ncbi:MULTISPECIES: hypothetical protein [unclassified Sulfurospirillum]|uniref:hypothetical protein n=1 Tax=unclassified Sulfurospirillum TaxID=2618290 RepID=UPI00050394FC|nr:MULTISPECIES: hypothetical protein [unclassified Sulfurospirillum]KFL33861.1 hypothetical protein JU57_09090 [Sulfurospirillum sp. SCADC]
MQTIQIEVQDQYVDAFLTLLANLKEGMIQNVQIDEDVLFETNKTYFQHALKEIENNTAQLLSHGTVWEKIDEHTKAHS